MPSTMVMMPERSTAGLKNSYRVGRLRFEPELVRFVLCGAVNAVLGYAIYLLCLTQTNYSIAYTVSFVCSIAISYFLNARFVFRRRMSLSSAFAYPVIYVMQYFAGLLLLNLLIKLLHLSPLIAPIIVVLVTVPFTFLATRYIMKGRAPDESRE